MTGWDLRNIRRFNRISQPEFARLFGRSSRELVSKVERNNEFVPTVWVNALSYLLGVNLNNEEVLRNYFMAMPEKYKTVDPRIKRRLHSVLL